MHRIRASLKRFSKKRNFRNFFAVILTYLIYVLWNKNIHFIVSRDDEDLFWSNWSSFITSITYIAIMNYYFSLDVSLLFLWIFSLYLRSSNKSAGNIYYLHFLFHTINIPSKQKQKDFFGGSFLPFFIHGKPTFMYFSRNILTNLPDCIILDSWVFDRFMPLMNCL